MVLMKHSMGFSIFSSFTMADSWAHGLLKIAGFLSIPCVGQARHLSAKHGSCDNREQTNGKFTIDCAHSNLHEWISNCHV